MRFTSTCPFCGAQYPDVDDSHRGQKARCRRCNNVFLAFPDNPEHQALREKARQLRMQFVRVAAVPIDLTLVGLYPRDVLSRCRAIPVGKAGDEPVVAMADPTDLMQLDDLRRVQRKTRAVVGPPDEIDDALRRLPSEAELSEEARRRQLAAVGGSALAAAALAEIEAQAARDEIDMETSEEVEDSSPAKRAMDKILGAAVEQKASEIRLMERDGQTLVQCRTAEGLKAISSDPSVPYGRLIGRLKDAAGCDPTKRGEEQSGAIPFRRGENEYEFLFQVMPAANSERAALRLFDASTMRQRRAAERRQKVDELLDGLYPKVWPPPGLGLDPTAAKDFVTDYPENDPAVARLAYALLLSTIDRKHQDLVIEPHGDGLRALTRASGQPNFEPLMTLPRAAKKALIARLMIMANIDLARRSETRFGMFSVFQGGQGYECRMATLPTEAGLAAIIHMVPPGA